MDNAPTPPSEYPERMPEREHIADNAAPGSDDATSERFPKDAVLTATNLVFAYPDGTKALDGVNFHVARGEVVCIAGSNGSGKTTLLKQLNGLYRPREGEVRLGGKPLDALGAWEVLSRVGMVFQDPNDQLVAATVEEDVAFGPLNMGVSAKDVARRVQQALERVRASELAGRPIFNMSYGQMKRVAIAGVLAMHPEVILLDEPASGLDPQVARDLLSFLRDDLAREEGIAVVMATHHMDRIPEYADRMVILGAGRVHAHGTPADVFSHGDVLRECGLEVPAVARLFGILAENGVNIPGETPLTPAAGAALLRGLLEGRPPPPGPSTTGT